MKITLAFSATLIFMIAFAAVFGSADFIFTQLVLLIIVILLIWQNFQLLNTSNRRISKFLFALRYRDFSISFPEAGHGSFEDLQQALNHTLKELEKKANQDKENVAIQQFLLERIPFGIIVVREGSEVVFVNENACKFLDVSTLNHLSELDQSGKGLARQLEDAKFEQTQKLTLNEGKELQLQKVKFKGDERFNIFFLQSIEKLRDEIEMKAWMNLIGVLTHEIVNSVSSISSLAKTLSSDSSLQVFQEDAKAAIESIGKQAEGLISFTDSYREVSGISSPNKEWFLLSDLIEHLLDLMKLELKGIEVEIVLSGEQRIYADRQQLCQVLINLFLNSKNALTHANNAKIVIQIWQNLKKIHLRFIDNGCGISPSNQNQIFVPFYTTKANGKGIGLTLCRQLMRNNNASISLENSKKGSTAFKLTFSSE